MAENSKIEWCRHTENLWWGCTEVHEGCDNCYARLLSERFGKDLWGVDKPRSETKNWLKNLNKYQKKAAAIGEVHRVFVGSMMDIFEKPMPVIGWHGGESTSSEYNTGSIRNILFNNISSGAYPNLMFLFLTKRPSNINKYIPESWKDNPPANVMFGTSVVNQETADKLIPQLLEVNGKKFLSMEPLLGPVNLEDAFIGHYVGNGEGDDPFPRIDWIIVGGESGPKRRAFDPDWARSIRDECKAAGVPFFMKQWDKVKAIPDDLMIREFFNP